MGADEAGTANDGCAAAEEAHARAGDIRRRVLQAFVVPVAAVIVFIVLSTVAGGLNPKIDRDGTQTCALVHDDLVHLALADEREAKSERKQWEACDASALGLARGAVLRDLGLIAVLAVLFIWASWVARQRRRWRSSAAIAALFAATYVVADLLENLYLYRFLQAEVRWSSFLPWAAHVKFGAFVAAAPIVVVAMLVEIGGGSASPRTDGPWITRLQRFLRRWWTRARVRPVATVPLPAVAASALPPADPGAVDGGMGVSCSGGGVRSAAFTLGVLQSMDAGDDPELRKARWMTAVSGGSYMAAAWVTARRLHPDPPVGGRRPQRKPETPPTWARLSPEEDHLRRHASYLAPGLGGKLWGATRFLFSAVLNLGFVVLAIGVLALPIGWAVATVKDPRPVSGGVITLEKGGCLRLGDESFLIALPGTSIRLAGDRDLRVAAGRVEPPKSEAKETAAGGTVPGTPAGGPPSTAPQPPAAATCTTAVDDPTPPTGGELPATAVGQRFDGGSGVPILAAPTEVDAGKPVLRHPALEVQGRAAGCPVDGPTPDAQKTCTTATARRIEVGPGSVVFRAPVAFLTLDDAALSHAIDGGTGLVAACREEACERFTRPPWLQAVVLGAAALLLVGGVVMVAVDSTPTVRSFAERVMRRATLVIGVALLATFVIGPVIVWLLHSRTWLEGHLKVTAGAGTGTLLLALVVQLGAASGATETPAGKVTGAARKLGSKLVPLLAKFAGAVVGPLLMLAVTLSFAVHGAVHGWSPGQVMLALALLGPLLLIGGGADLNAWSLHPYYKERLLSAYAVDPRVPSPTTPLPQPVDGPLPPFIRATASQSDDPGDALRSADGLPELVICAAANLTDDSITAPGRRVVSWVFNDQAIGSRAIAGVSGGEGHYRPDDMPERYKDLASTWTAVAVSGAAFAPAMGKMTRPERTLFALGNLRLGVWYPNPRYMATTASEADRGRFDKAWYDRHHPRPWYLVKEALGLHKLNDPWVYVTDGGHYENLGLVELLRRRCTEIYCFDAAGDQTSTFGTLADAMRIARAELGVEIKIDTRPLQSDEKGMSKAGVGVGTVHYPPVTAGGRPLVGWIVIAKLTVPEKAPFDIIDLARTLRSFPTHPTSDQLYTDQKFEAYRALGAHLSAQAVELGGRIRRLTTRPGGESSRDVPTAVALMQGSLDPPGDDEPDDTDEAPAFDS